jgi:hypothetical protein
MADIEEVDIEELVSKARAYIGNRKDNRFWCNINKIKALLEEGATPMNINNGQMGEGYSHEVFYKGIIFINATEASVPELEKYVIE